MAVRDLFISSYAPTLGSGRALRTYMTVRALAALGPLDMAFVPHDADGPSPEYEAIENVTYHVIHPSRGVRRAAEFARRRVMGTPPQCARACSPELVAESERLAALPWRGRVIAGDMSAMTALMRLARTEPVIYNAHNVESSYRHDPNESKYPWLPMKVFERQVLRRAYESWMVSHLDMARAGELEPKARLRYVPNVVDVGAITPAPPPRPGVPPTVLMLGDFTYEPNQLGLALLAGEVMPRVWDAVPEARLRVVGRGAHAHHEPGGRIDMLGFVEDLEEAYRDVTAVAVPLTESGGTPLKFIEAMAHALPVVATPLAAQGLAAKPGEHYRAGADAGAFAAELVKVLQSGDPTMAVRARQLAQDEYSLETLIRLISE